MKCFHLIAVALFIQLACAAKQLPSAMKRCKENDITSMDCLKEATQDAILQFIDGIAVLGVFSIDPLQVTEMAITQGGDSPVSINLNFKNETIRGFGNMRIDSVTGSSKIDDYNLHFNVFIPKFEMIGDYVIDGKVLVLPITGKGYSNLTLVDMTVKADIIGRPIEKKGDKYLEVTDFQLDIEPQRLYIQLDNLFNGDAALGSHMNNFLNENWSLIFKELKPSIGATFGAIFKEISNRIYGRVPYKNIVL